MRNYISYLLAVFVLPMIFTLPIFEAGAQDTVLCLGGKGQVKYRGGEEGSCKSNETQVVVSAGAPGPEGPPGEDGMKGAQGNDGADALAVTTTCTGKEILLADGTCLDVSQFNPSVCPCFDGTAILGQGIDFDLEEITLETCHLAEDIFGLTGVRDDNSQWTATVEQDTEDADMGSCTFIDAQNGIDNSNAGPLTNEQVNACFRAIRASTMFLNTCADELLNES